MVKLSVYAVTALLSLLNTKLSEAFAPSSKVGSWRGQLGTTSSRAMSETSQGWNGEVVTNEGGKIKGCKIEKVEGSVAEWVIQVDGQEADLGKFSDAIYRKITSDAKQQRFQGFRPGTLPPHLLPTYISFTMDECAREATLEAMQQNNIRPFDDAREQLEFDTISILPPKKKGKKKKKKKGGKKNKDAVIEESPVVPEEPQWLSFDTMKEAISKGWKPGQSFSFVARNVKGQQLQDQNVVGSKAIGAGGSALDLNNVVLDNE